MMFCGCSHLPSLLPPLFLLFKVALTAYGGFQARGLVRAVAAGLPHSHTMQDLNHVFDLHHSSQHCRILNPLSKARDGICILMDASQIRCPLSHDGNTSVGDF